ncbi:GTPase HflX [Vulcanisaeta thermophila]|uniref:GTPase HflX n=1 Tax=Vulcanisaeta thermophila TaxID=867917 RepID=UPI001EE3362E|nr:GTPase HflX [Vulcanisaeta thermophila]
MNKALLLVASDGIDEGRIREFRALAEAADYEVMGIIKQRRRPDSRYYMGPGKLEEIARKVIVERPDVVITYHQLNPIQYVNLEKKLRVKVMDRVWLILSIFERRAGSAEAKLQIELARLRLEIPRVREYIRLAKAGEQIGFYGGGEYAIEAYYRYARRRVTYIKRELERIRSRREGLIIRRRDYGLPQVVITGYTSAGKTTLFNLLTGENKYVDGKPFATLDTYSRLLNINGTKVIITDTIGFIDDLPPLLIESFYTTIAEILNTDLVLLMIDASEDHHEFLRKYNSTLKILSELGVNKNKVLPVLNKVDLTSPVELNDKVEVIKRDFETPILISAKLGIGIDKLKEAIVTKLNRPNTFRNSPNHGLFRAS